MSTRWLPAGLGRETGIEVALGARQQQASAARGRLVPSFGCSCCRHLLATIQIGVAKRKAGPGKIDDVQGGSASDR